MRICQIEFQNFRGIRDGRVILPKHAVLLGANNAGDVVGAFNQVSPIVFTQKNSLTVSLNTRIRKFCAPH